MLEEYVVQVAVDQVPVRSGDLLLMFLLQSDGHIYGAHYKYKYIYLKVIVTNVTYCMM